MYLYDIIVADDGRNTSAILFDRHFLKGKFKMIKIILGETNGYYSEYFFPMEDEETVLLIDSWKDQSSIDVHHASPMMAKIIELRENMVCIGK